MDGMLTLTEVIDYLDLEQGEVERLVKQRKLNAYKIGGTFLRFKKDQVVSVKSDLLKRTNRPDFLSKARDYWYFNRIYILSAILLVLLIYTFIR